MFRDTGNSEIPASVGLIQDIRNLSLAFKLPAVLACSAALAGCGDQLSDGPVPTHHKPGQTVQTKPVVRPVPSLPDKIDDSALNPDWVHVPRSEARANAHCGNTPTITDGNDTSANLVWLSLDDSPAGYDGRVARFLEIGEKYDVKFHFFPVSSWTDAQPGVVPRMRAAGHEVDDHTRDHPRLDRQSKQEIDDQVDAGVHGGPYLRPPYGAYNRSVVDAAKRNDETICTWTVDTVDYSTPDTMGERAIVKSPEDMLARVKHQIGAHAVILMHMHGQFTVQALPKIIVWLQHSGYKLEKLHSERSAAGL